VVGHTAKERGMVSHSWRGKVFLSCHRKARKGLTFAGIVENKTQVRGNVCHGHPFYCSFIFG
jgi:hypothetical protein